MGFHNLAAVTTTQRVKPDGTNWETTAATGTITSGTIDTLGYDGIHITTTLGTVTSTGTISQTFNSSPDASTWSAMKYASAPGQTNGTTITATAGSTNTKQKIVVDIYRPTARYVQVVTVLAVANTVIDDMTVVLYKSQDNAAAVDATVATQLIVNHPSN